MKKLFILSLICLLAITFVSPSFAGGNEQNGAVLVVKGIGFIAGLLAKNQPEKDAQEINEQAETTLEYTQKTICAMEKAKGKTLSFGEGLEAINLNDNYSLVPFAAQLESQNEPSKAIVVFILFQNETAEYQRYLWWEEKVIPKLTRELYRKYFAKYTGVDPGPITAQAPAQTLTLAKR